MESGLDRERIEGMAREILIVIRGNYLKGPVGRDRVYEVLNALAFCAAATIRGSDMEEGLEWFSVALNKQLDEGGDRMKFGRYVKDPSGWVYWVSEGEAARLVLEILGELNARDQRAELG